MASNIAKLPELLQCLSAPGELRVVRFQSDIPGQPVGTL
jgi:hypothetical protein